MTRSPLDRATLRTTLGGRRVDVVETTRSTNADLLADLDAPAGAVLVAEEQTGGRGRLDRAWHSPARAGLLFSVALRPSAPVATWGWLPLLAGLAVRQAVATRTGIETALKWPNDVLHAPTGGKLAGILVQSAGGRVVAGVGLNVSTTREELPVTTATSLALCGATDLDRGALLVAMARRLDELVERWNDVDGDAVISGLREDYLLACNTIDQDVLVTRIGAEALRGTARGIDRDGRLEIEIEGRTISVAAGDVEHLRPRTLKSAPGAPIVRS